LWPRSRSARTAKALTQAGAQLQRGRAAAWQGA
jgi:hypothetical protein